MSESIIALVGSPNSGKTTLYNWLTNSNFKTVNYPGATVEYSIGKLASHLGGNLHIMDTPGVYSLFPRSQDEEVTVKAINEPIDGNKQVEKIIVVCDGTQLERHLMLARQIKDSGAAMIIVITMFDIYRKQNIKIDTDLLKEEFECPVVLFDGVLGQGLQAVVTAIKNITGKTSQYLPQEMESKYHQLATEISKLAEQAIPEKNKTHEIYDRTAFLDSILLHPFFGFVIFASIMTLLFASIYWMAAPFMDLIDGSFSDLAGYISSLAPEGTLWTDFLANGVVASFGAVFVFIPQIFILFLGIGFLESTGYLARAATLIDKPFSKLGLSGRSFVPVLSGFACAVPAIMATRNISSKRDRLITSLIIPLMTCSARLPVYALLLAFLMNGRSAFEMGAALAALYIGALVISAIAATILNRFIPEDSKSLFMMELPLYRWPRFRIQFIQALKRTQSYITKAGPVIFLLAALIWAGTTFPRITDTTEGSSSQQLEQSYLGKIGQVSEPLWSPMGVDWRVGLGLMTAFAAREVFVSSLAIIFKVADEDEETQQQSLLKVMSESTKSDGTPLFTFGSVLGLIVFFMIAMQCMATYAITIRELGSNKIALIQLIALNVLAYISAIIIYQISILS